MRPLGRCQELLHLGPLSLAPYTKEPAPTGKRKKQGLLSCGDLIIFLCYEKKSKTEWRASPTWEAMMFKAPNQGPQTKVPPAETLKVTDSL